MEAVNLEPVFLITSLIKAQHCFPDEIDLVELHLRSLGLTKQPPSESESRVEDSALQKNAATLKILDVSLPTIAGVCG